MIAEMLETISDTVYKLILWAMQSPSSSTTKILILIFILRCYKLLSFIQSFIKLVALNPLCLGQWSTYSFRTPKNLIEIDFQKH